MANPLARVLSLLLSTLVAACAAGDLTSGPLDAAESPAELAVYCAPDGRDDPGCGLTAESACATPQRGIARAQVSGRKRVLLRAGAYAGPVVLADGVDLLGGFDQSWRQAGREVPGHQAIIKGGVYPELETPVTLLADGLTRRTEVRDLVLLGDETEGQTTAGQARSSIAVLARGGEAELALVSVTVIGGRGADGAAGVAGLDAPLTQAMTPMAGRNGGAATPRSICDALSHGAGGAAGLNACPTASSAVDGGRGGEGGPADRVCQGAFCASASDCVAPDGGAGGEAELVLPPFGSGGSGGLGGISCGLPGRGSKGRVQNGLGGTGGDPQGLFAGDWWHPGRGGDGQLGADGGGGGGGGGSGGCDVGLDATGAGGGGGGAGGCAARSGGSAGGGGGGAFAVVAKDARIEVIDSVLMGGVGGRGGGGGAGGRGQSGGPGGAGGAGDQEGAAGAAGGHGGHGGHGGGGGGGAGGPSVTKLVIGAGVITVIGGEHLPGLGGGRGQGGASAPSAPSGERDGWPGHEGAPGLVREQWTCRGRNCQ